MTNRLILLLWIEAEGRRGAQAAAFCVPFDDGNLLASIIQLKDVFLFLLCGARTFLYFFALWARLLSFGQGGNLLGEFPPTHSVIVLAPPLPRAA